MEVLNLIEYLEEVLDTSSKMPMTNKIMINKGEVQGILDEIKNKLPEEIKKAQWICEDKARIINEAHEQAELIKKESIDLMNKKVHNHEYIRMAEDKSHEIMESAQRNAKTIQFGAIEYASELLVDVKREINYQHNEMMESVKKEMEHFIVEIEKYTMKANSELDENLNQLTGKK